MEKLKVNAVLSDLEGYVVSKAGHVIKTTVVDGAWGEELAKGIDSILKQNGFRNSDLLEHDNHFMLFTNSTGSLYLEFS